MFQTIWKSHSGLLFWSSCCCHATCHMRMQAGGSVQQRKINDLSEIAQEFDLVVNCAGLGSKELFKDDKLTPVRCVTVCAVAVVSTS